jgi:hypothetical protein
MRLEELARITRPLVPSDLETVWAVAPYITVDLRHGRLVFEGPFSKDRRLARRPHTPCIAPDCPGRLLDEGIGRQLGISQGHEGQISLAPRLGGGRCRIRSMKSPLASASDVLVRNHSGDDY